MITSLLFTLIAFLAKSCLVVLTWTTPRTWVPGELVTASMMNIHVRDNLNSLRSEHFSVQNFRGLSLRTHPDNDVTASKVELLHADELVMDDGTRVTAVDRLVADVTASGAGGLDTGSEGASRFYEVYVIRKSTDGTLNLLLHRAKDWTSDVSFTTATDAVRALRLLTSTPSDKLAQGVQFASSKPFRFFNTKVIKSGSVSGNIWWTLESDSAGSPSGVVLATSRKISCTLHSTEQDLQVIFDNPYTVTASTQYHLVMQGDYTRSDTVFVSWRGVLAGGYAGGSAKAYNGATWSSLSGTVGDFNFNCFVEQNDTAVTMPSGYDQKCLVCPGVRNDGSSNFIAMRQVNNLIRYRDFQSIVASGTATVPALIDLSTLVPCRAVSLSSLRFTPQAAGDVYVFTEMFGNLWTEFGNLFSFAGTTILTYATDLVLDTPWVYYAIGTMTNATIKLGGYRW